MVDYLKDLMDNLFSYGIPKKTLKSKTRTSSKKFVLSVRPSVCLLLSVNISMFWATKKQLIKVLFNYFR